jgi:septum formation protein
MFPIIKLLNINKPFVLASKSPRRKKLLEQLGFELTIIPASINEDDLDDSIPPSDYVMELSARKAKKVAEEINLDSIVLGSDTTVVLNGKIINKPQDRQHAYDMLNMLSGNTHKVFTGITLIDTGKKKTVIDFAETDVTFRKLDPDEIWAYIDTGSPMDKAGAYGIQDDFGAVFVSHIVGCYYNIVGLPLEKLYTNLKKLINEK